MTDDRTPSGDGPENRPARRRRPAKAAATSAAPSSGSGSASASEDKPKRPRRAAGAAAAASGTRKAKASGTAPRRARSDAGDGKTSGRRAAVRAKASDAAKAVKGKGGLLGGVLGAIVLGGAAAVAAAILRKQDEQGHKAPDLASDRVRDLAGTRAPDAFRPDATAPVTGDRSAFAPAPLKPDSPNQA